jgi:hypothetical protein
MDERGRDIEETEHRVLDGKRVGCLGLWGHAKYMTLGRTTGALLHHAYWVAAARFCIHGKKVVK